MIEEIKEEVEAKYRELSEDEDFLSSTKMFGIISKEVGISVSEVRKIIKQNKTYAPGCFDPKRDMGRNSMTNYNR